MKTEEFKSIVRSIIQEELKVVLPTMIPKILTEVLSNNVKVEPTQKIEKEPISEKVKQPTSQKQYKKYTNNEMLNQILNETTGGVPQEGSFVGYSSILNSQPLNESINIDTPTPTSVVNEEQSKVLNVMNRDYRKLMKAVDNKKKSGNIPTGMVQSQ